ncbi:unnamed protein product [Linum tenue]|uniref:F-box domain-containing protein n=1 Tax=Linum tenue TaxID=586396 RepID=A0AAV0QKS8_9ROSI|nr:unnamed protein product [Linum tenue]
MTSSTHGGDRDIVKCLPAECLAHIISFTSPSDACRSSVVSCSFQSIADSDDVWKSFLPSDHEDILSGSESWPELSAKELYLHLCHNPVILTNQTMSFALERQSGKKCYMVGSRGLEIVWGDTPAYWIWTYLPESRFGEVAELQYVWWFDIKGRIETRMLSPATNYAAYFVFQFSRERRGFSDKAIDLRVQLEKSGEEEAESKCVIIDPPDGVPKPYQERGDGWLEIEIGEFFNDIGVDDTLLCNLMETDGSFFKAGLIVEGIEFRPKTTM